MNRTTDDVQRINNPNRQECVKRSLVVWDTTDIFVRTRSENRGRKLSKNWQASLTLQFPIQIGLLLLATACLPGDSTDDTSTSTVQSGKVSVQPPTRAPLKIDPDILKNRTFTEAPILATRVTKGQLPPVEERLPENPLVVVPMEKIGRYGGTIRRALTGDIVQTAGVNKTLAEGLMGYERPLPKTIQHNLAESYRYEDDGRVAIFKIRKGIKWSDGHPFTVDDVLFWYYDTQVDDDARDNPVMPTVWLVDDKPIQMEKIDDHTLRVSSAKPLGRVLQAFCATDVARPKHYFARLHPRYNPEATYETFRDSTTGAQVSMQPGVPRLSAWYPVQWERGQRIIYERNPYYWKVDTAGNQLPYADRIEFNVIQDSQVILLKFMNGEIDLFGRYAQTSMYPTLKAGEQNGKFKVRVTGPERGLTLYLNWDAPNPALREAFRERKVRVALSHAINREEINEIIFHGLLDESGYSLAPQSPYFDERLYRMYTRFDPDLSRKLLDEAGFVDLDGDGVRELKDGTPFSLNIDVVITPSMWTDAIELIAAQWAEVGVKAHINTTLRDILWPRRTNGEFDIHIWGLEGPADPLARLNDWAIMAPTVPFWHRNASDEAQPWLREVTEHIHGALTTIDSVTLRGHMERVNLLHTENVPNITIGSSYRVWGAGTRLGNVPYENTAATVFQGWSRPVFHEQVYIKKP